MYYTSAVWSFPPQGTAAMRNTKRGSWFIQELNSALRLHARDTHLADILVQVNMFFQTAVADYKLLFWYIIHFWNQHVFFFSFSPRWTVVLRRGRATPQVLPTTAAKKCQSSPAQCAKTSTFSPNTSPSINMHINTHRSFLVLKPGVRASQLFIAHHTLTHSPLLQLDIQMSSGFNLSIQTTRHSQAHTHIHKSWKEKRSELLLIYMYMEMGNLLAYNVLMYIFVCLCLCQLEGLDVNPLQSNCTATLSFHKPLFKMYFVHRSIFVALFCMEFFL